MMAKKLKDIIQSSDDLYAINIIKKDKHDKSTWEFKVIDPRWKGGSLKNKKMKAVYLRRGNYFFIAYKTDDLFDYFVDVKRSMFRNSISNYIGSQIQYSVYSNDISITKNEPSFRITQCEMTSNKIYNFLDLCYYYRYYTAIGTGYTRNLRNLIVMDIDVDCTKQENKIELNNLLLKFASLNSLPNFYIFNNESKHIQLQWLIQNYNYKEIDNEVSNRLKSELENEEDKNCEMKWTKTDFTKISEPGLTYRKFTMGLCEIVEGRRKFGDKNYTFWKAKNPMSALCGAYCLELKMPYYDGEIKFLSQDEMESIFSNDENRKKYYENAPTFEQIKENMSSLMDVMMSKVKDKKIESIIDDDDLSDNTKKETKKNHNNLGKSRNTFVLNCTYATTWEIAREMGLRKSKDIKDACDNIRRKVFKQVKKKFIEEDKKYNGIWPDTTNMSNYDDSEFKNTFNDSFIYATNKFKNLVYTKNDRMKSQEERHLKKNTKIILVDKIRNSHKNLSRDELHKEVNKHLDKPMSLGSFKRFLSESKKLSDESRKMLYDEYNTVINKRKNELESAIEENKSQKTINTCKKRYEYLLIS